MVRPHNSRRVFTIGGFGKLSRPCKDDVYIVLLGSIHTSTGLKDWLDFIFISLKNKKAFINAFFS